MNNEDKTMTPKDWLEYLNNYNERYLIRQQSSGFSKWALTGVFVLILYRILDSLPEVTDNFYWFVVFFLNALIVFSVYLCSQSFLNDDLNIYLENSHLRKLSHFFIVMYVIVVAMGIVSSIWLSTISSKQGFYDYGYLLIAIVFAFYLIVTVYRFYVYKRLATTLEKGPVVSFVSMKIKNGRVVDGLGGILFLIGFIFSISGISWQVVIDHVHTLQLSIEFFVILFIILYFLQNSLADNKMNELQVLEHRIVLYNLTSEQIREDFYAIMFEKTVTDWIENKKLSENEFAYKILTLEQELNELLPNPATDLDVIISKYNELIAMMDEYHNQCHNDNKESLFLLKQLDYNFYLENFCTETSRICNQLKTNKKAWQDNIKPFEESLRSQISEDVAATTEN